MPGTTDKIRVIIADDHPLVRHALRDILAGERDISVVGEASNGEDAITIANELLPDIVIMDITMPKVNGLEATRQIKAKHRAIRILALTVHEDDELILSLLQAGVDGYLVKTAFNDEVVQAVRTLKIGEYVLSPVVLRQVLKYALRNRIKPAALNPGGKLSEREMELLKLLAKGMTNKDIASAVGLSLRGVKAHLVSMFAKLNAASRTEAILLSLRMGILTLDDIQS